MSLTDNYILVLSLNILQKCHQTALQFRIQSNWIIYLCTTHQWLTLTNTSSVLRVRNCLGEQGGEHFGSRWRGLLSRQFIIVKEYLLSTWNDFNQPEKTPSPITMMSYWARWRLKSPASLLYSGVDKENESSASLAFVQGIHRWSVNSQHKGPVTRKMFPIDVVIMRHVFH